MPVLYSFQFLHLVPLNLIYFPFFSSLTEERHSFHPHKQGAQYLGETSYLKQNNVVTAYKRSIDKVKSASCSFKGKTDQLNTLLHWINDHQSINTIIS